MAGQLQYMAKPQDKKIKINDCNGNIDRILNHLNKSFNEILKQLSNEVMLMEKDDEIIITMGEIIIEKVL